MTSQPRIGNGMHLDAVDGLRGAAALLIVAYHCFANAGMPEWRPVAGINVLRPLHDGWSGVNLFLVLSGFCLYWPYARRPERQVTYASHMKRRSLRILPAYYASLLLVPALLWAIGWCLATAVDVQGPHGWLDAGLHLAMLHAFTAESFKSWNGVTWSLGLEWCWYLLFPLAVLVARRRGVGFLVAACAVITVAYRVVLWIVLRKMLHNYEQGEGVPDATRSFVLGRLFEFSLGMGVAVILAKGGFSRPLFWAACAAVVIGAIAGHVMTPVDFVLPVRDMLYGVTFAAALLLTVWRGGAAGRVMGWAPIRWIGECSYSLYLFHMPWVIAAAIVTAKLQLAGPVRFMAMLCVAPVMVVFARLMYRLVEKPFMSIGREGMMPAAVAAPVAAGQTEELHVAV